MPFPLNPYFPVLIYYYYIYRYSELRPDTGGQALLINAVEDVWLNCGAVQLGGDELSSGVIKILLNIYIFNG